MKGVSILTLKKNQAYKLEKRIKTIEQAYEQIREIIQKQRAPKGFVGKWVKRIGCAPYHLEDLLKELDIETIND